MLLQSAASPVPLGCLSCSPHLTALVMPVGHTIGHMGIPHPKITVFPRGTLLHMGMALTALVNKAKTLNYFSSKAWTPEQVITG